MKAFYARSATGENNALEIQLIRLRSACKGKGKPREYCEVGSGNSLNRPKLNKLLDDADKKKFKFLYVCDFARLSRKTEHLIEILSRLQRSGVKVVSLDQYENYTINKMSLPMGYIISGGFVEPDGKVGPIIQKKFSQN